MSASDFDKVAGASCSRGWGGRREQDAPATLAPSHSFGGGRMGRLSATVLILPSKNDPGAVAYRRSLLPQEGGGAVFELAAGDAELVEEF